MLQALVEGVFIEISGFVLVSFYFRYAGGRTGAYCASKFAVIGFSDSLRFEMYNFGVNGLRVVKKEFAKNLPGVYHARLNI